jgi:hypothetical protein
MTAAAAAAGITEHLGFAAADEKGVKPMTPLFEVSSPK